jgi:hypothetical protein
VQRADEVTPHRDADRPAPNRATGRPPIAGYAGPKEDRSISRRTLNRISVSAIGLWAACAAGCSPHYAVTQAGSDRIYLTRSYEQTGSAATFKDRVTNQRVTVDTPEITVIGEHEYRALRSHLRDRRDEPRAGGQEGE